jgi:hypothetical protein
VPFGQLILKDPDFRRGRYSTHFVEGFLKQRQSLLPPKE